MSNIRDDELDIGLSADPQSSREAVYAEPVRGGKALKGLYAPGNRKRLYAYVAVGVLLLLALIYTFVGAENPEHRGGGGEVRSSGMHSQAESERTMIDREEVERYNTETLAKEQEVNMFAHPIIATDKGDELVGDDEYVSPFEVTTDLSAPTRLSQAGDTHRNDLAGQGQAQPQEQQYYDEDALQSADDLARILIEGEAAVPALQTVAWQYAAPRQSSAGGAATVIADGESLDEESSTRSCAVPLARAGSMVMATTDIALNSDVGGPAALTIHNGKLRGSRLIGSFERRDKWLRLEFSRLVTPDETLSVSAIGLDLDTTLNAVSGKVNHHTMYRYGWWGFGTVLSAIGKASAANADSTVIANDSLITESTTRDSKREMRMALGYLGEGLGSIMQDRLNREITVSLKVGEEVGVFFMDDVCLERAN